MRIFGEFGSRFSFRPESQIEAIRKINDKNNESFKNFQITSSKNLLIQSLEFAGSSRKEMSKFDDMFSTLFYHNPSKEIIQEVQPILIDFLVYRIIRDRNERSSLDVLTSLLRYWDALGLIEYQRHEIKLIIKNKGTKANSIDDLPSVIQITDAGKQFLKNKHESLPIAWIVTKDLLKHPLAIIGYLIGLISGVKGLID